MGRSLMGNRLFPTKTTLSWSLVCVLIASAPALAADYSCSIEQLSQTSDRLVGARAVAFSANGRQAIILTRVSSDSGPVAASPELFQVDLLTGEFTQLTQTRNGTFSHEISADSELNRIVFVSDRDLIDENPGQVAQLFLFTSNNQRIRQLTGFTRRQTRILSPRISGDGSVVVFLANANPLGSNRDLSSELFLIDLETQITSQISQLSQVTVPSAPSLSADGTKLAYLLTHTLSGFSEIDLIDLAEGHARLIYTAPRLASPVLTADGTSIFFVTDIDPEGDNLDRSLEIFRIDVDQSAGAGLSADQLSNFAQLEGASFDNLAVSGDGAHIVFRSQLDLSDWRGEGADNLYLFDIQASRLEQLTHLRGFNEPPTTLFVGHKGKRILFSSGADLTGQNSDGNPEAFAVGCESVEVYFFSQIGDGRAGDLSFRTSFILANTGPDTEVQIDFFTSPGQPLRMDLGRSGSHSSTRVLVRRGTPLILGTRGLQNLRIGFARIKASSGISGSAVFTGSQSSSDTTLYEAAVPLTEALSEFSVVVNTLGHYQTGLAIVNPPASDRTLAGSGGNSGDAELLMRLYDDDFNLLGERVVILPPGRHQSSFVAQLFPQVSNAREMLGLLTVQSSYPVAVVTLRLRDNPLVAFPADVPNLTTLPVAPGIPDTVRPARSPDSLP